MDEGVRTQGCSGLRMTWDMWVPPALCAFRWRVLKYFASINQFQPVSLPQQFSGWINWDPERLIELCILLALVDPTGIWSHSTLLETQAAGEPPEVTRRGGVGAWHVLG